MFIKRIYLTLMLMGNIAWGMDYQASLKIDGSRNLTLAAGKESQLEVKYLANMGNGHWHHHRMFMSMHDKLMHMVVIKRDLSHFAHVHPAFDENSGTFKIKANSDAIDGDNLDQPRLIPTEGEYFVFTEAMPMPMDGSEHKMVNSQYSVMAKSNDADFIKNSDEFVFGKGPHVFYFDQDGKLAHEGSQYKLIFSYDLYDFCDRVIPKFYLEFQEHVDGEYREATGFEKWLGMGGHGVLLSAEDVSLEFRQFRHLHAFLPIAKAGAFTFPYDELLPLLPNGNYKFWFQVKHKGTIKTFPISFNYQSSIDLKRCR